MTVGSRLYFKKVKFIHTNFIVVGSSESVATIKTIIGFAFFSDEGMLMFVTDFRTLS